MQNIVFQYLMDNFLFLHKFHFLSFNSIIISANYLVMVLFLFLLVIEFSSDYLFACLFKLKFSTELFNNTVIFLINLFMNIILNFINLLCINTVVSNNRTRYAICEYILMEKVSCSIIEMPFT